MKKKLVGLALLIGMATQSTAWADDFNHDVWDGLLSENIVSEDGGKSTMVDYAAIATERERLKSYLSKLSEVEQSEFDSWDKNEQLAFLINAYNAWTVELILTAWPEIESIRDLGSIFSSPWEKEFIPLFGEEVSLDHIEHGLIRGSDRYNDPRIHFAVNCASIGCPALRAQAFTADQLEDQLNEQTEFFLSDSSRNRLTGNSIELSSIFKWYREDFEKGWLGYNSLEQFLLAYAEALQLNDTVIAKLTKEKQDIDFLKYDWKLNKTQ